MAARHERHQRLHGIAADRHTRNLEGELLLGEAAGGVVVLERDQSAGNSQIFGLHIEPRQRDGSLQFLFEIADRHGGAIAGLWRSELFALAVRRGKTGEGRKEKE